MRQLFGGLERLRDVHCRFHDTSIAAITHAPASGSRPASPVPPLTVRRHAGTDLRIGAPCVIIPTLTTQWQAKQLEEYRVC